MLPFRPLGMKTISDHILDIVQNSVAAGATLIEIIVCEDETSDIYSIEIKDNGKGMSPPEIEMAMQPFYTTRTTRKVGLGLPLLKQNTEMTEGKLMIDSTPGRGTTVRAEFGLEHIDRPPLGDMPGVFVLTAIGHPGVDFTYRHHTTNGYFGISTAEIKETLEGLPLQTPDVRKAILGLITENLAGIKASL